MKKYFQVFKISFSQEIVYKMNFIMWRVRNILQFFMGFFLWDRVFADPARNLFGYDRSKILTYVFGLLIIRAFVLSSKTMEVAGEIQRGDLSGYLIRPLDYFKYWLTRDIASKVLNLAFAVVEIVILFFILKPPFFIQTNLTNIFIFGLFLIGAILMFSIILFLTSCVAFWMPEMGWGAHFLITVVVTEFLSGALFPLDVFPALVQKVLYLTPFPYLIFFPLQVYLGKIDTSLMIKGFATLSFWLIGLYLFMNFVWKKGLRVYEAYGR